MKISLVFLSTILLVLPFQALSDSIEIVDWDVSEYEYIDDDTNETEVEAYVFAGETVTWTYDSSLYNVVEFEKEEDFENCNMTAATEVDASGSYSILAWPFRAMKGKHYFASGIGTDCSDGKKIELQVRPKMLKGSMKNSCEGVETATATEVTGRLAKSPGRCRKQCRRTQDCFGFEWTKQGKTRTCTLFDDYPSATGVKSTQRAVCLSVKFDNTKN